MGRENAPADLVAVDRAAPHDRPSRRQPIERSAPAVLAAALSAVLVAAVAGIPEGPLTPKLPVGAEPIAPFRWLSRITFLDSLSADGRVAAGVIALSLAGAAFVFALSEAWRGRLSLRLAVGMGIALSAFAVTLPLLGSGDVFQYALYGKIAGVYHANPYVLTPVHFRTDPLFRLLGPEWRTTPSVYGPSFVLVASGVARAVRAPAASIITFKVLAGAASVGTLVVAARTARAQWPSRAAFAAVAVGWNPIVLYAAIGGGHMDCLIALATISAFALLVRARRAEGGSGYALELLATALLTATAMLKFPLAVLIVPAVAAMVWRHPPERRARLVLAHAAVALAVGAALVAPYMQRHDPSLAFFKVVSYASFLAPSTFFRHLLAITFGAEGTSALTRVLPLLVRAAFGVTFLVVFARVVRKLVSGARGLSEVEEGAAWAWLLLAFILCAPILFPWYLVWMLPLAWLFPRIPRLAVAAMCAVLPLAQAVGSPLRSPSLYDDMISLGISVISPLLFLILVRVLRDLNPRLRTSGSLTDALEEVPAT